MSLLRIDSSLCLSCHQVRISICLLTLVLDFPKKSIFSWVDLGNKFGFLLLCISSHKVEVVLILNPFWLSTFSHISQLKSDWNLFETRKIDFESDLQIHWLSEPISSLPVLGRFDSTSIVHFFCISISYSRIKSASPSGQSFFPLSVTALGVSKKTNFFVLGFF